MSILVTDINSPAFFDNQFRVGEWERNNGPAQTRYFMMRLVAEPPEAERRYIAGRALTVVDWGCALGDGLDPLQQAFPQCTIVGQGISLEAVTRARRIYPQHEFIVGDEIRCDFDVIVASNCLEHFADPLRLVETQLGSCRRLYLALVPFEENPLYDGHLFSFDRATFPPQLGSWTRIALRPIEMDPRYWLGSQLLVVYGSEFYVNNANDTVHADVPKAGTSAERDMNEDAAYRAMLAAEGKKWGDHLKIEASGEWNSWLDHPFIAEHYRQRALVDGLSWPPGCGARAASRAASRSPTAMPASSRQPLRADLLLSQLPSLPAARPPASSARMAVRPSR